MGEPSDVRVVVREPMSDKTELDNRGTVEADKSGDAGARRNFMCCPYCSDSKFPCFRMEKVMREKGSEESEK